MGILQALFGSQMGQQGMQNGFTPVNQMPQTQAQQAPQTLGLVQDILSQRFQPQGQDVANSIFANGTGLGTNGGVVTPEQMTTQRLAPVMDIAKTLGTLNQSQLEIAKLNELMRHDRATELQNPFSQPISTSPTTIDGNQSPSSTATPANSIPTLMQNNVQSAPQASPQNIPQAMQNNIAMGPDTRPATSQREANAISALTGGAADRTSDMSMAQPNGQVDNPSIKSNQIGQTQQPKLTPLYRGNVPYTEGLDKGYQWAQDENGKVVATQIPGTVKTGENGAILTTNPQTGQTTQAIPKNPQAQAKFESNLKQIADLFDQLHQEGGSVEENGSKLNNIKNVAIAELPGGQMVSQGSKAQTIRNQIQNLIKQTTPIYMQAMGITPGMERAVSAQQMLQAALGGSLGQTRQANQASLANLSQQAGTGEYANQYQMGQPIKIIAPDGTPGTISASHVQDLLNSGGKLAQ